MAEILAPADETPSFPRPLVSLRQYVQHTLYLATDEPEDLRLLVESDVPPFTDEDVYTARISGADQREAQAAFAGKPVAEYVPSHSRRQDPVTHDDVLTLDIGASDRDPTSVSASNAPLNHWILRQQPAARPYIRRVPRAAVLACVDRLCAADIQALRNLWLLNQRDAKGDRKLSIKRLVREHGYSTRSVHRHHNAALAHLLDALLAWHRAHPEPARKAA